MSLKTFDEEKQDAHGDMRGVKLDKETINCNKCDSPMHLSEKGKYECKICSKL